MPTQLGVVFSTHAVRRWRERVSSNFDRQVAVQMVTESRLAHKSERRQLCQYGVKPKRRATTKDKLAYRVNDAAGLLFVCTEIGAGLLVKTVWKLEQ